MTLGGLVSLAGLRLAFALLIPVSAAFALLLFREHRISIATSRRGWD